MDQIWRDFPRDQQYEAASALATYGKDAFQGEAVRVQLAILHIARGDMGRLLHYLDVAKGDYRTVLLWSVQKPQTEHSDGSAGR